MGSVETQEPSVVDEADALLERAHRAGYRYPSSFAGFEGILAVDADGSPSNGAVSVRIVEGRVVVEAPTLDAPWAGEQLRSMVSHRLGRPYSASDGRFAKHLVDDGSPLGLLIEIDDPMASSYRVANDEIALVTRAPGGRRFSIAVQERLPTPDGTLVPKEFAVFYWNAEGGIVAAEAYSDRYEEVGSLLLPQARRIVRADSDGVTIKTLALHDHALTAGDRS